MTAKRPRSFAPSTCWNSTEGICGDALSSLLAKLLHDHDSDVSVVLNKHYEEDGAIVFREACKLGCEGIVSKRLGSIYRSGRSPLWLKVKNPNAPAAKREAEEDWAK